MNEVGCPAFGTSAPRARSSDYSHLNRRTRPSARSQTSSVSGRKSFWLKAIIRREDARLGQRAGIHPDVAATETPGVNYRQEDQKAA